MEFLISGGEQGRKSQIPKAFSSFVSHPQTPAWNNNLRHLPTPISVARCKSSTFSPIQENSLLTACPLLCGLKDYQGWPLTPALPPSQPHLPPPTHLRVPQCTKWVAKHNILSLPKGKVVWSVPQTQAPERWDEVRAQATHGHFGSHSLP